MKCFHCQKEIEILDKVGFRDDCEYCGSDLHVCLNCTFYDERAYNECRETSADRVVDKERANFCEYFQSSTGTDSSQKLSAADEAKRKLEELFKKKS